ncbi:hypothetical protein CANARDRAFT_217924 [[Candida] arabinofermentans NRRL YB-2248]|uniref:Uncharacterized protein n=1 Tax=[Candida] arabinofermentans NRRL YB-2248 TaxID=983967 RepID=A0A1E4T7A3_9ASCO|nr:hypothetical protein CANARDRAFT_217924 [[Candida] arabinofermentans NRRL YB-2248]
MIFNHDNLNHDKKKRVIMTYLYIKNQQHKWVESQIRLRVNTQKASIPRPRHRSGAVQRSPKACWISDAAARQRFSCSLRGMLTAYISNYVIALLKYDGQSHRSKIQQHLPFFKTGVQRC